MSFVSFCTKLIFNLLIFYPLFFFQTANVGMPMQMQQTKPDDIQAILAQNDSKTMLAENLLKQFGSNIKQEVEDDRNAVVADSTTNFNSQRPIKCEATSISRRSPNDLKNEPVLKIENIYETNRKVNFNTQMTSKQIQEAVR